MKKLISLVFLMLSLVLISTPVHASDSMSINGPDMVFKQSDAIVTIHDILLLYEAPGAYLTFDESRDGFTGNGANNGIYDVTLIASNGLTEIERTIQIKVITYIGNITLVTDSGNIYVRPDQILTFSDIRNVLKNIGIINIPAGTGYQIIKDDYSGNESTLGFYDYKFRLISPSGAIQNVSIKIFVTDDFTSFNPDDIIQPEPSPLTNTLSSISSYLIGTVSFIGLLVIGYFAIKSISKIKKKGGF